MKKIIFIGAGGHAKSVIDSFNENKRGRIVGFIDSYKKGSFMGLPIFGIDFLDCKKSKKYFYFITIGDNFNRKKMFELVQERGLKLINIIDKTALISKSCSIGVGCYFGKYTIVNADARIDDNVIINNRALIEHECVVNAHSHISTNTVLNGGVKVEEGVFVGSSSVINEMRTIKKWSIVGSGSVVICDVEAFSLYAGVPAKFKKELISIN